MASSVVAQIVELTNNQPHPNADKLELFQAAGWQLVCGIENYKEGDRVVYITPDSLITEKLADKLGITNYLSTVKNQDGSFVTNEDGEKMLRVRQAKLRGEPSFGTTIPADMLKEDFDIDITKLDLGTNLAGEIGIEKYLPIMRSSAGDAEVNDPMFVKYTDIENLRNYPNVLQLGEPVTVSEKIHGQNLRVGLIDGVLMAGSHGLRRKEPEDYTTSSFWYPLADPNVLDMLHYFYDLGLLVMCRKVITMVLKTELNLGLLIF
jgi:RNA ligase (TIGR02306 family)